MYTGFLKVRRASSRGLLASELGNVALVTAIAMPLLIGSAGLGVETSYWYYKQLQLQSAADTAAYAAGLEKRSGSDIARITLEGSRTALKNGYDGKGSLVVNSPPLSGPNMAKP